MKLEKNWNKILSSTQETNGKKIYILYFLFVSSRQNWRGEVLYKVDYK